MKLALVCSSGGHLTQLHQLKPFWEKHERFWVTFKLPDSESLLATEDVTWAHYPTTRNVRNTLKNLALAARLLRKRRPELVVSDGAGVAFPFFVMARLLRHFRRRTGRWSTPTGEAWQPALAIEAVANSYERTHDVVYSDVIERSFRRAPLAMSSSSGLATRLVLLYRRQW